MADAVKPRPAFLRRRETILIFFLFAKTVSSVIVGRAINSNEAWGLGILALLVYLVLAWFTYKRQIISIWAISVIMLYEASGPFINTLKILAATPMDNTIMSILTLIVSGYILYGALVIFQSRHQCE